MKNKFIKILFFCVLSLSYIELAFTGEFNFEISELEILDSGNVYKGNKRGKITTDNQIEIISNNFIYSKKNLSLLFCPSFVTKLIFSAFKSSWFI